MLAMANLSAREAALLSRIRESRRWVHEDKLIHRRWHEWQDRTPNWEEQVGSSIGDAAHHREWEMRYQGIDDLLGDLVTQAAGRAELEDALEPLAAELQIAVSVPAGEAMDFMATKKAQRVYTDLAALLTGAKEGE